MSRPARDGLEWIDDEAEEGAQPRPCRVMIAGLPMRESFTDQQITVGPVPLVLPRRPRL